MTRILIFEGNTLEWQDMARRAGLRTTAECYSESLLAAFPTLSLDILHAADRGQHLPPGAALSDYDGLVVTGSILHAYDDQFEVSNQIDLIRQFGGTGKPILGSCWGLQSSVAAAGGEVAKCTVGAEIGIARKITQTDDGRGHPMYVGKPISFDAPCYHGDIVTRLPSDSVVLSANAHSEVQSATFKVVNSTVWGVQYHPEFDLRQLEQIMKTYASDLIEEGLFASLSDAEDHCRLVRGLIAEPNDKALQWRLAIGDDILKDAVRQAEIRNWVRQCVIA